MTESLQYMTMIMSFRSIMMSKLSPFRLKVLSNHINASPLSTQTNAASNENEFRYTLNNSKLSNEQRKFYEENGYILMKNMVPQKEIDKYTQRFRDIANRKIKAPFGLTIQKEVSVAKAEQSENTVYRFQKIFTDEVLFEYCKYPPILDIVEGFCGKNQMAMHTILVNKPPDIGTKSSRHPLHQDLHYFAFRPADRIVCAWTAMEKVNRANGCLVAIPGTHKGEHLEHDYPDWEGGVNKMYYGVKNTTGDVERVHLEMESGDTVFFHPLLIHGSGANRTSGYRKAISCHYAASECEYIDVRGTIQEKVSQEILEIEKKKGIEVDDLRFVWKARAHLVRGQQINL